MSTEFEGGITKIMSHDIFFSRRDRTLILTYIICLTVFSLTDDPKLYPAAAMLRNITATDITVQECEGDWKRQIKLEGWVLVQQDS